MNLLPMSREQLGVELIHGWDVLESLIIRCGEVAAGQEFREPGTRLHAGIAHGQRGGYFDWADLGPLLRIRCEYLTAKHPRTSDMRDAVRDMRAWDQRLRHRLGPLAPAPVEPRPWFKPL